MKRALLVLWVGLLVAWAQSHRGLLVVFDSRQTSHLSRHKEVIELLRQKRAEGHFAGTGLDQYFQIYNFAEPEMAASLKRMGISQKGTYLCLTQLDAKNRPVKVSWRQAYSNPAEALAALDQQLGLTLTQTPEASPSPPSQSPDKLNAGSELAAGSMLESPTRNYRFAMQTDGNCVLYRVDGDKLVPVWGTESHGLGGRLTLDNRGRLRVLSSSGETLWASPEHSAGEYQLQIQDDGNLVLYRRQDGNGVPVWSWRQ